MIQHDSTGFNMISHVFRGFDMIQVIYLEKKGIDWDMMGDIMRYMTDYIQFG